MGKVNNPVLPASLAALKLRLPPSSPNATPSREKNANPFQLFARAVYPYALFLVVPLLGMLLFAPLPFLLVGYVGVLLLFLARWLALSSPFPVTRINPILLVLALSIGWGMLHAATMEGTVLPVAHLLAGITTMYVVIDYAERPGRLWNIAVMLVVIGLGIALVAPLVTEPPPDKLFDATVIFRPGRLRAQDTNPNEVAAALGLIVPLALALVLDPEKKFRIPGLVSLPPVLIMLGLLQARSIWAATIVAVLLFPSILKRWVVGAIAVVLIVVLLYGMLAPGLGVETFRIEPARVLGLVQGRQQVWDFAAGLIVREPLGIGINAFTNYANNLASDWLAVPQREHAHNMFLQAGLDVGLIGMGAFAALFAFAFYASWHAIRHSIKRILAVGLFVALVVAFIGGMFESNLWGSQGAVLLWALFGMAVVLGRFGARGRRHTHRRHHRTESESAS